MDNGRAIPNNPVRAPDSSALSRSRLLDCAQAGRNVDGEVNVGMSWHLRCWWEKRGMISLRTMNWLLVVIGVIVVILTVLVLSSLSEQPAP